MSLTAISSLELTRKKFFMNPTQNMCKNLKSNVLGSGGRNESNSHQLARIEEKRIFQELEVHHVCKVGIKRFWAQQAERSLTAISSLEWTRKKFFMNATQNMCKNLISNVFGLRRPK